eukprot:m.267270 g.267270  ORF g.267270 m.267270 type:complete len:235 (+) comp40509_c0_seq1:2057-2761(+)
MAAGETKKEKSAAGCYGTFTLFFTYLHWQKTATKSEEPGTSNIQEKTSLYSSDSYETSLSLRKNQQSLSHSPEKRNTEQSHRKRKSYRVDNVSRTGLDSNGCITSSVESHIEPETGNAASDATDQGAASFTEGLYKNVGVEAISIMNSESGFADHVYVNVNVPSRRDTIPTMKVMKPSSTNSLCSSETENGKDQRASKSPGNSVLDIAGQLEKMLPVKMNSLAWSSHCLMKTTT